MRASDSLKEISAALRRNGVEDSYKEAEIIVTRCIGIERTVFYRDNPVLSNDQTRQVREVLERRRKKEPLQYIIGHVDFSGLTINVGPGVLIPRPETELIVEETIRAVTRNAVRMASEDQDPQRFTHHGLRILDLCTGSGCIALAIARRFPGASIFGTDLSETALKYARENALRNGVANVTFLRGDLYAPLDGGRFDIIVSNPPYVKREEIAALQPEIREWEPPEALNGGEDGLRFYREIVSRAPQYLAEGGSLIMELGAGEAGEVLGIAEKAGFRPLSLIRDFAGIERVLHLISK